MVAKRGKNDSGLNTIEYPKGSKIKIREIINTWNGKATGGSYQIDIPASVTGKGRVRKQFKDLIEAKRVANTYHKGNKTNGQNFFQISDTERGSLIRLHSALKESKKDFNQFIDAVIASSNSLDKQGLDLQESIENYLRAYKESKDNNIDILEAVNFASQRMNPTGGTKTFSEIAYELINIKRRSNLKPVTLKSFETRALRAVSNWDNTPIASIQKKEIIQYISKLTDTKNKKPLAPRSKKNHLVVISEIFSFGTAQRYLFENPIEALTKPERKSLIGSDVEHDSEPAILTIKEAEKLLETALINDDLDLLPAVVLGLFCGLRTEELKKLKWSHLKIEDHSEPFVQIPRGLGKGRYIRNVPIPENALKWLKLCPKKYLSITREEDDRLNYFQKRFQKLYKLAGMQTWENNSMRHSFGTYYYNMTENVQETMSRMGHRESDMLFNHYRALTTKKQAQEFFRVTPNKDEQLEVNKKIVS